MYYHHRYPYFMPGIIWCSTLSVSEYLQTPQYRHQLSTVLTTNTLMCFLSGMFLCSLWLFLSSPIICYLTIFFFLLFTNLVLLFCLLVHFVLITYFDTLVKVVPQCVCQIYIYNTGYKYVCDAEVDIATLPLLNHSFWITIMWLPSPGFHFHQHCFI